MPSSKAFLKGKRADLVLGLSSLVMMRRPVDNLSIVLDVVGALKPHTLRVPGGSYEEESLASLSPG
eukprot:16169471-Heterocapsa_arctica.AAC.1